MADIKSNLKAMAPWALLTFAVISMAGGVLVLRQEPGVRVSSASNSSKSGAKVDRTAPNFEVKTLDGKKVNLAELRGKVIIIDFWSITCGPCIDANRHLQKMYEKYNKMGLEVVGLSVDPAPAMVKRFLASNPVDYPMALATDKIIKDYGGVYALPLTFVIDKRGKIARKYEGYSALSAHQMETLIKKLLSN